MLGPVPALTVSWANYFLLPASLTLPAFSCPAHTSAHFMQSNVKVQEIWGNVKSHLLCDSVLADAKTSASRSRFLFVEISTLLFCKHRFEELGWCDCFSPVMRFIQWTSFKIVFSWLCFWLPLRYGTSLMPSESMTISLFLVFWMRVKCQEGGGRKLVRVGIFNSITKESVFKGGSSKTEKLKESRISPEFFYFFIRTERSEHLILSYLISAWRIQQQGSAYAPGRKMTSALFYFLALQSLPSLPSRAR